MKKKNKRRNVMMNDIEIIGTDHRWMNKASDIMADFKMRGKEALNRVSEFIGLKEKLTGIRDKVKEGIADTNRILAKIDTFGKGMREATQ